MSIFDDLTSLSNEETPRTPQHCEFWIQESPSSSPSPSPSPSASPQPRKVKKLVFPPEAQQSIVVTIGSLLTRSGVRKSQRPPKPNKKFL